MAKLSKMEISAIANKIAEDVITSNKQSNDTLCKEKYEVWFNKFKKTQFYKDLVQFEELSRKLSKLTCELDWSYRTGSFTLTESMIKSIFKKENKLELKPTNIDTSSIERDIIIAQAKNEDLDALIASLTEKYSK